MNLSREQQSKTEAYCAPLSAWNTLESSVRNDGLNSLAKNPCGSLRKQSQLSDIGGLSPVSGVATESAQGLGRTTIPFTPYPVKWGLTRASSRRIKQSGSDSARSLKVFASAHPRPRHTKPSRRFNMGAAACAMILLSFLTGCSAPGDPMRKIRQEDVSYR